jgi:hypothetical protein
MSFIIRCTEASHQENSINNNVDPTPLVAKSIEKDIDMARTHLNNHVTTEEEILTLDKNCEYCQCPRRGFTLGFAKTR